MKLLALLPMTALLIGCATDRSRLVLPPIIVYSRAEQAQAAREIESHGAQVPMLTRMVGDYGNLRAAIRAAKSAE